MNVAERMGRLGTESAFEVLARARALERQGREVVHLEIGEPDFDTPAHIKEAAKRALDAGATHYGPSAGLPELREAIAKHIGETRGVPVSPEQVVVTPGAKPIMFFTILALIGRGDECIYPNPGFPIYESVINFAGGVPVPIPLREESGFGFDMALFEQRVSAKTKLIIVNSPQNPTGGVLDRGQIERIAQIAAERRIPVLTDEIYRQFLYDGEFVSFYAQPGMHAQSILLDGFSKTFAMTGWRLGYGVMPVDLAEHVTRLMVNSNSCTASFVQLAGVAALHRRSDAGRADGGRVQAPPRHHRRRAESTARRELPLAARGVLRLPERHRHPPAVQRGRRAAAAGGRRGRAVRHGVRRARRGLSAPVVRQLRGQSPQGAGADAARVRSLRALSAPGAR